MKRPRAMDRVRAVRDQVRQHGLDHFKLLMKSPALVVWVIFLLLYPVYTRGGGKMQPRDLVALGLIPLAFMGWDGRLTRHMVRTLAGLALFLGWVLLVNVTWAAALDNWSTNVRDGLIANSLYYLYNATLFFVFLVLFRRYGVRFLRLTMHTLLATLTIQAVMSLGDLGLVARGSASFASPNQLGYFAVLCASILVLGHGRLGLGSLPTMYGLVIATYLSLVSASKAALGAVLVLVLLGMFNKVKLLLGAAALFAVLFAIAEPFVHAVDATVVRMGREEKNSFLDERGYDRIFNHPEHVIFGSGEGGYTRWKETTVIGTHEIHSSLGTLIFCYGIVGTTLFGLFIARVISGTRIETAMMLLPAAAYGVTHQGLRFSLLWFTLGFVLALRDHREPAAPGPSARRLPAATVP